MKRLLCSKLQWWTLPRDGHIFVRTFRVGLKIFCYGLGGGGGGGGGEIRTYTTCCLQDIKAMETVKVSSTLKHPSSVDRHQPFFLLISTPINRTFSESLIVPDYCFFLLKNQNINAI